jgi:hypothetical protein
LAAHAKERAFMVFKAVGKCPTAFFLNNVDTARALMVALPVGLALPLPLTVGLSVVGLALPLAFPILSVLLALPIVLALPVVLALWLLALPVLLALWLALPVLLGGRRTQHWADRDRGYRSDSQGYLAYHVGRSFVGSRPAF